MSAEVNNNCSSALTSSLNTRCLLVKHFLQFSLAAFKSAQIKLNEVNAAGTGNINPIHVNTINNATKGIQVIPHWLSSLLLIELRLAAWVSCILALKMGQSRFMGRMSESLTH
ncbi:hypothetical protein C8J56DRAFT_1057849 [Mycena floridula]|nr:hypothetical protein C8J56DRAFT_1057849 [Mycena floridula]